MNQRNMKTIFNHRIVLCFILFSSLLFSQELKITGIITSSSTDEFLTGVNISVLGTSRGTLSSLDGTYSINAIQGETLVFSFIGMTTVKVLIGIEQTINIAMEENVAALDEVIIIAYGQQTRQKLVQSVSTVNNGQIRDLPADSPQDLLQGQASGVQVVNGSGILGSGTIIKIRGVASLSSGGSPLIVVDGVPLNDSNLTLGQGGQPLNPLGDVNPNDIESFSVLKDAAATAIYGSRGANGVILITTKKGKINQKTQINIDVTSSWSEVTDTYNMMNADQFRQFRIDIGVAQPGQDPQGSYDWPSNVVRTGFSNDINFNASGGSEKTTFYIGATHKDQEGFIVGNNLKRLSGRVNVSHNATDWLKLGVNLGITENKNDRVGADNSTFAPMTTAYLQVPWVEPYDDNGNFVNTGFAANVIAIEALDINDSNSFRTIGNIFAEIDLMEGLTFKSDFGIDRVQLEEFQRTFDVNFPGGLASDYIVHENKFAFTNSLNYRKSFNDIHDLSITAGIAYEEIDSRYSFIDASGFLSDDLINIESASTINFAANGTTASRLVGYFTRANYSYDDKYIAEGSFRRDGSSRFGMNNRYGNFYSIGGAWMLSKEQFLQDVSWISSLKLRANYGSSGNDRIGDFASLENFSGGNLANYSGGSGLNQTSAANPDLKWERSKSFDIGFETSLFNNRLNFAVDYYNKRTSDLILNVPIPLTNGGIGTIIDNVGEMKNYGFDIDASGLIMDKNDFKWNASINLGINTNEVLSLPGANLDPEGRRFISAPGTTVGAPAQRAIEGFSVNTFYLIRYVGINPATGDAEWLDYDGNITNNPTSEDRVIVGDANPDFVGGLRNTLSYKNWDLNFFFNFSVGNDILVTGLIFADNAVAPFNNRTIMSNIWEAPGDNAHTPSSSSPTLPIFSQQSTAQLKDASYARLKNIVLGYNVPQSFLNKVGFIDGLRLYISAQNMLTIKSDELEGIDPEVTDSYDVGVQGQTFFTAPQSKTFLTGIRITF